MGYYLITEPQPRQTYCTDCVLAMMAEAGLRFSRWLDLVGDEDLACEADFEKRTITVRLNQAFKSYPFESLKSLGGCCS